MLPDAWWRTPVAAGADGGTEPLGPGLVTVEVTTHYSQYSDVLDDLEVHEGTLVRFVVTNDDPIHHELIVGDDAVHAAHETGHEAAHPPVPGEVSVDPGETGLTTYRFDDAGQGALRLPPARPRRLRDEGRHHGGPGLTHGRSECRMACRSNPAG